jgi:hypothetical protein
MHIPTMIGGLPGVDGILTVGGFYKQGEGLGTHMLFI